MVSIICSNNIEKLNDSEHDIRVLLYGSHNNSPDGFAIGNMCKDEIARLKPLPSQAAFDLLSIALSVVAADSFIVRADHASDGFSRAIDLTIALGNAVLWEKSKLQLEKTLNFLTGDKWSLLFIEGGERAPTPLEQKNLRKLNHIYKADSVCLFSGGLDSFIGAIQQQKDRNPVLVSRSSTGDQRFQNQIAALLEDRPRFVINDSPKSPDPHEISTRARSFLFLALGAVVCSSLESLKSETIPLIIPENGFIALNPPLKKNRIGANSTRTAHPYYLSSVQAIFDLMKIPARIENPFRFKTKGEMLLENVTNSLIVDNASNTVSCGHWKRANKQCGRCWPCLIRRTSFFKAGIDDSTPYQTPILKSILNDQTKNYDLRAVLYAIYKFDKDNKNCAPIRSIRFLPTDPAERAEFLSVVIRGFEELREFLFDQEVWL